MATLVSHSKNPKAYVYFISDGDYVKIGKSGNVVERLAELQCGNPKQLHILFAIPVKTSNDAGNMENALHLAYQDYRMCGEWFDISEMLDRERFENEFGISKTVTFTNDETEQFKEHEEIIKPIPIVPPQQKVNFMTIRQIAKTGILPEYRIRQLVMSGEIPSFKAGNRNYVNYANVVSFLESY